MDVMRTRYVKHMEKWSVASSEVSGHFARLNSTINKICNTATKQSHTQGLDI